MEDTNKDQSVQICLLAQEVKNVFPELVREDNNSILSVNYTGLAAVLIDAVKEQQRKIETLEKEVQWLMEKLRNNKPTFHLLNDTSHLLY